MTHLGPERLFRNPIWHALEGPHRGLAIGSEYARRYPAGVAPFAAVGEPTRAAYRALEHLLGGGEALWIAGQGPYPGGLRIEQELECLQMVLPRHAPLPTAALEEHTGPAPIPLSAADAADMVALTDVAFPGFFRPATHRMGAYYGIRIGGRLIAMAGERLRLRGFPELSGICTHPEHRGQGLARRLIAHLVREQRRAHLTSWLHVSSANTPAIALYRDLGFETARTIVLTRIARAG